MNYFGSSHTYAEVLEPYEWMRRRVRLYDWKQWSRSAAEATDWGPGGDTLSGWASTPAGCTAPAAPFYDAIEATSRLILAPMDRSATSRSCSDCNPTQNAAEVPKNLARRNAVSADKLLLHFVISVRREGGMPVERDTDTRLSPIGLMNSSSKISPG